MKRYKSTAKQIIILSLEDEDLRKYAIWGNSEGYISIYYPGSYKSISASKIIVERMGLTIPEGCVIDHINVINYDNRRENLRVLTFNQNRANNKAKGVYYHKRDKVWTASVVRNNKTIRLGTFLTEKEAIKARVRFLKKEGLVYDPGTTTIPPISA